MQGQLKALRRLARLYDMVERTHAVTLQRCATEVREAERAIELQRAAVRSAAFEGRAALVLDDRVGWSLAKVQRELARWRSEGLEHIRAQCEVARVSAQEHYVASRIKSEQMRCVVNDVEERAAIDGGRRSQAESDDRYLSRRSWVEARASRDPEMNGS